MTADTRSLPRLSFSGADAYNDSDHRYHLISSQIAAYEAEKTIIGFEQAVNITSLVGQKGSDYFHWFVSSPARFIPCLLTPRCRFVSSNPGTGGSNVLSVAYHPVSHRLWAAWEDGANETWTPASCAAYVELDFARWF
jgi:hypothetical protein